MPEYRGEDIVKSKDRKVKLETFEMMLLTEQEFHDNLASYMVRKCDFIEFVMKQWQSFNIDFANAPIFEFSSKMKQFQFFEFENSRAWQKQMEEEYWCLWVFVR